ncbi:MAG: lipopolysaccharide biosynthesis protein RfbH [Candidatus Glassbacteria bacterium]|nr:lipopolysaccharide biosynthesis protein RfbH [Candidatus Glassbacteria bacterium]
MEDKEKRLREKILGLVREYYAFHAAAGEFVPQRTRIPYGGRVYDGEELAALVDSSLDFWLTLGERGREFSGRLAKYLGRDHCLLVNSGSSANLLAFAALCSPTLDNPIKPGDEVITVAAGFPTTVNPVIQYGCVPVFVDIDPHTLNVDASLLEPALSSKTRAVMIAHMAGNPFEVESVLSFVEKHGLYLVEDNCDALGSRYQGRLTGSFGHLATQSFYASHHITMGSGGAVLTDNPELHRILVSLRDWGRDCFCGPGEDNRCGKRFSGRHGSLPAGFDHKYVYSQLGYNLQPLDLQAAIGLVQMDKLESFIKIRRENHQVLGEAASLVPWLRVQQATPRSEPSWFGLVLTLAGDAPVDRRCVLEYLEEKNIQTRLVFAGNIIRQPAYRGVKYRVAGKLTNTDLVMERTFFIGVYPGIDRARRDYMAVVLSGLKNLSC